MEFRLTYEGMLLAHRNDKRLPQRSLHVHAIRKKFQTQLKNLWRSHPVLAHLEHPLIDLSVIAPHTKIEDNPVKSIERYGYSWLPIVQRNNGLVCELDILMLREGSPGGALHDIDNRLKTVFDALRMANGPQELGAGTPHGEQVAGPDEMPFCVLVEDDRLITKVSVATDMLLEPVPDVEDQNDAVRLVIGVTVRPYHVHLDNLAFS